MQVYLFPGQGSQYVGMGREWFAAFPAARAVFERADEVLGFPLSRLCFEGPEDALNETVNTQPAVFTVSVAALRALEERGMEPPAYVAGHSLGEFSALVAADSLVFEDGLRLVRERGRLMQEAGARHPGGMAAVLGLGPEPVEEVCAAVREETGEYVGVANDNCPGQLVISGAFAALEAATEQLRERGARRVVRLAVSIAAHSPLMAEAAAAFQQRLAETEFREPRVPVIGNATAGPLTTPSAIREALGRQLTSPVRWTESLRYLLAQGATRFVEVGPKDVLSGLVRRVDRKAGRVTAEALLSTEEAPAR